MKLTRRMVLRGIAGTTLGLPLLESVGPRPARAAVTDPFLIVVVHGNGVQQSEGGEPERFWPSDRGALTTATMGGRAVDELVDYQDRLLVVDGVHHAFRDSGDHSMGGMQLLTAQDAAIDDGDDAIAAGESLDWRIGRELNPAGREPLNLYAGRRYGYLDEVLSYRGRADRRPVVRNPWEAYLTLVGAESPASEARELLVRRRNSINDLVRGHMERVLALRALSRDDRQRLERHMQTVRDLEVSMSARLSPMEEMTLEEQSESFNENNFTLEMAKLHMTVAALAVVTGASRAAVLQVGSGNDGTRYEVDGVRQESFHWVSHRVRSDGGDGPVYEGAEMIHHRIDRMFLATFAHLLDRLDGYGALDDGVAVWTNNLATGPYHSMRNLPFVMAGSCQGVLHQGRYVSAGGVLINRMLNTLGSAVGLRGPDGGPLTDFGDSGLSGGLIPEMIAEEPWA